MVAVNEISFQGPIAMHLAWEEETWRYKKNHWEVGIFPATDLQSPEDDKEMMELDSKKFRTYNPMKIIIWNCRCAGNDNFYRHAKDLLRENRPGVVILIETEVQEAKTKKIVSKLNFGGFSQSPPDGRSGGIWLLWDKNKVDMEILAENPDSIDAVVKYRRQEPWVLSGVYAKPDPLKKQDLWEKLSNMSVAMDRPWIVAGDLNDVRNQEEKRGAQPASASRMRTFNSNIEGCGLIDLGYIGPKFTWCTTQIKQRLDRVLVNEDWRTTFPEATVYHLPKVYSDHHPLLLDLEPNHHAPSVKPFRFEYAWSTHAECKGIVEGSHKSLVL